MERTFGKADACAACKSKTEVVKLKKKLHPCPSCNACVFCAAAAGSDCEWHHHPRDRYPRTHKKKRSRFSEAPPETAQPKRAATLQNKACVEAEAAVVEEDSKEEERRGQRDRLLKFQSLAAEAGIPIPQRGCTARPLGPECL